jgi:CheY-like chemotaxis protein
VIVDDNRPALDTLHAVVERLGHDVRVANDGREAIKIAKDFLPDAIIMDIGMPQMDGHQAARLIRGQPWGKNVLLVALTGWGQDDDKRRTKDAGFDHHLVKPADPSQIAKLLSLETLS